MTNDVGALFTEVSCEKLDAIVEPLKRCMERLNDEQVWARGGEHENAVGNLILHLMEICGSGFCMALVERRM